MTVPQPAAASEPAIQHRRGILFGSTSFGGASPVSRVSALPFFPHLAMPSPSISDSVWSVGPILFLGTHSPQCLVPTVHWRHYPECVGDGMHLALLKRAMRVRRRREALFQRCHQLSSHLLKKGITTTCSVVLCIIVMYSVVL